MTIGTVLVVEDDAAIRRGIADSLRFAGYGVLEAADGVAGLSTALSAAPDLVLLDVLMPKRDGFEVLGELRRVRRGDRERRKEIDVDVGLPGRVLRVLDERLATEELGEPPAVE